MGHLLQTMNPEAVDRIGGDDARPPGVGSPVVYIARAGEGRAGKTEFPALVLHVDVSTGALTVLVFYAEDDMITRERIPQVNEDFPEGPAWKHVQGAEPEKFEPSRLNQLRSDVNALREDFDKLANDVYGQYEMPEGGVIGLMIDFESKLKDLQKSVGAEPKKAARSK